MGWTNHAWEGEVPRTVALWLLSALQTHCGSLSRTACALSRVVKWPQTVSSIGTVQSSLSLTADTVWGRSLRNQVTHEDKLSFLCYWFIALRMIHLPLVFYPTPVSDHRRDSSVYELRLASSSSS